MNRRNFFSMLLAMPSLAMVNASAATVAGPVLLVVAHPDDEYYCAATVYRMAVQLGIPVDEFVITNGEGGYRYSTLAEPVYGVQLTREEVGRRALPAIRKQEVLNAGKILGIRDHYFLDERDEKFTTDINDGLVRLWDSELILNRLSDLMRRRHYQFVIVILPRSTTHGHHQAASVLAIRAVRLLPENARPVILGMDTDPSAYVPVAGVPETQVWQITEAFQFDRTAKFGFQNALSYQIVVNWMIAEHKSQGLLQTMVNQEAKEYFWVDAEDTHYARQSAAAAFDIILPLKTTS